MSIEHATNRQPCRTKDYGPCRVNRTVFLLSFFSSRSAPGAHYRSLNEGFTTMSGSGSFFIAGLYSLWIKFNVYSSIRINLMLNCYSSKFGYVYKWSLHTEFNNVFLFQCHWNYLYPGILFLAIFEISIHLDTYNFTNSNFNFSFWFIVLKIKLLNYSDSTSS